MLAVSKYLPAFALCLSISRSPASSPTFTPLHSRAYSASCDEKGWSYCALHGDALSTEDDLAISFILGAKKLVACQGLILHHGEEM